MCQSAKSAKRTLPLLLPLIALLGLSACASQGEDAWVNMHQGNYYNKIFTGDDHI